MRTPEEMLKDIEECTGMCGDFCISCREMHCLGEIHDVMAQLIEENKKLKSEVASLKNN